MKYWTQPRLRNLRTNPEPSEWHAPHCKLPSEPLNIECDQTTKVDGKRCIRAYRLPIKHQKKFRSNSARYVNACREKFHTRVEHKKPWKLWENILEGKIMWNIIIIRYTMRNAWYIHVYNLTEEGNGNHRRGTIMYVSCSQFLIYGRIIKIQGKFPFPSFDRDNLHDGAF